MVQRTLKSLALACALATPAAAELVYLTEPEGQSRFMESELHSDYFSLASYLEFEQVVTFCGPASVAAVANSLDIPRPSPDRLYSWTLFTQDLLFNEANQKLKPYAHVEHEGLTLAQLDTFIENVGMNADHYFADETSVEDLREALRTTLSDPNARFIANYSRKALPQDGDGHISPVAAYDEDTDTVLILDVAKYKYPPVWVTIETLHAGMTMKDSSSNRSRGFVIVSKP